MWEGSETIWTELKYFKVSWGFLMVCLKEFGKFQGIWNNSKKSGKFKEFEKNLKFSQILSEFFTFHIVWDSFKFFQISSGLFRFFPLFNQSSFRIPLDLFRLSQMLLDCFTVFRIYSSSIQIVLEPYRHFQFPADSSNFF